MKEFNKIAAVTRKKAGTVEMKEPKKREAQPRSQEFESEAERIAQSKFHKKYFYFDGGREAFPQRPNMWFVEKCFPYAVDGQLLIDEPNTDEALKWCVEKAKFLKSVGFRYVILHKGVDEVPVE